MSQSRRRQFLIASGGLLAASLARAQPARRFRVGCLWVTNEVVGQPYRDAFLAGMRERGYVLGSNFTLDERYGGGNPSAYPALAEELIALKPDVLVGIEGPAVAFRSKTKTIPIVLFASSNPVGAGLVQSLGRPGTNVTGLGFRTTELIAKHFELLMEISPKIARVAFFNSAAVPLDPSERGVALTEQSARKAAGDKGLALVMVTVNGAEGVRNAFERLQRERVQGLVVVGSGPTLYLQDEIIAGARRLRLPSIGALPAAFAEKGGLATYGVNFLQSFRYAAKYVDQILKGTQPAEMPIEQMATFELVINLKTARELGLAVPKTVLFRADRVIE